MDRWCDSRECDEKIVRLTKECNDLLAALKSLLEVSACPGTDDEIVDVIARRAAARAILKRH